MSVAVNTAVNAAALSVVIAAENRAKDAQCIAMMKGYQNDDATVAQRLEYAQCVERFQPPSQAEKHNLQIEIGFVLLAMLFGAIYNYYKYPSNDWFDAVEGAIAGFCLSACTCLIVMAVLFVVS